MESDVNKILKELDEIKKSLESKRGSFFSEFIINRLFADKVDIITKTIVGALIFLLFDALIGGFVTLLLFFGGKEDLLSALSPELLEQGKSLCPFCSLCFELSGQNESVYQFGFLYLTSLVVYFLKQFRLSKYETIVLIYVFLWAWGKLIYHLRQPVILDKVKANYIENIFSETKDIELFKQIKKVLWEELGKDRKFKNFINKLKAIINISDNDYLFYLLLGRNENLFNQAMSNRAKDADELAFLGTNAFVISIICSIFYIFLLMKTFLSTRTLEGLIGAFLLVTLPISILTVFFYFPELYKKLASYKIRTTKSAIIMFVSILLLSIIFAMLYWFVPKIITASVIATLLSFIILSTYQLTIQAVARRYISRNQRLYINYLTSSERNEEN